MSAIELPRPEHGPGSASAPLLRTLALCDLVDSTALVERLGDQRAAELMRRHDRLARATLQRCGGHEIDKTDGFLVMFERPIQAVEFALEYQRKLAELGAAEGERLRARVGIHVGDVVLWQNAVDDVAQGAKPVELEGLAKPVAARLMALARPGQILLSGIACNLAQRAEHELGEIAPRVRWRSHGRYCFKGVAEPVPVHEAGESGVATFARPGSGEKAWRAVPWWRRPRTIVLELVVIALLGSIPVFLSMRSRQAFAFAERDWIVVGDLRNLTGQPVFDTSLHTAFRISLEQSRFVNVVSDLQVRDALARMSRDAGTPIDHAVGSEIALREGARALIVPTIAEVGGRVRVSAEVVDPQTQTTVYAESADGLGAQSALGSVDAVTRELRNRLGEALAAIDQSSQPLAKVTTTNLEALRAYSLGLDAQGEGRFADALSLYAQALKLDPEFAIAHMGLARIRLSSDERRLAYEHLKAAETLRARMPAREALYLDALLASYASPAEMLDKWKLLGAIYPDQYGAHANYALFAWQYTNRYQDALAAGKRAIAPQNPRRGLSHYMLAVLELALDRPQQALEQFDRAREMDAQGSSAVQVEALAAMRRFDEAEAALAAAQPSGLPAYDVFRHMRRISLSLDRGAWHAALAQATEAITDAARAGGLHERVFRGVRASIVSLGRGEDARARVREFAAAELAALAGGEELEREHALFASLFAAWLSARDGDVAHARETIAAVREQAAASAFPNTKGMLAIAESGLALAEGDAEAALGHVLPSLDGTELQLAHEAAMQAHAAAGNVDAALREARWLESHRGRVYAEYGSYELTKPLGVALSNLALLRAAEIAHAAGRDEEAAGFVRELGEVWPAGAKLPFVAQRLARVAAANAREAD